MLSNKCNKLRNIIELFRQYVFLTIDVCFSLMPRGGLATLIKYRQVFMTQFLNNCFFNNLFLNFKKKKVYNRWGRRQAPMAEKCLCSLEASPTPDHATSQIYSLINIIINTQPNIIFIQVLLKSFKGLCRDNYGCIIRKKGAM